MGIMSPKKVSMRITDRLLEILQDDGLLEGEIGTGEKATMQSALEVTLDSVWEELTGALEVKERTRPDPDMDLQFTLEGETPRVVINNAAQVNFGSSRPAMPTTDYPVVEKRPVNKLNQIEENLHRLAHSGVDFIRVSTYHVKVLVEGEAWNLYLSGKEKWMRDGLPAEGQGIENFLNRVLIKKP